MEIYCVGGAVRDKLLGLQPKEYDWVVVGATAQMMLARGYQQVGKDFPVFLHPDTKEEYALARTERKIAKGHTGFECQSSPDVTLEDDLKRRDLTINAIAEDQSGQLIDPYGGQEDLSKKILRHVSPAFIEDPLRILRIARFSAKLVSFKVAKETHLLMLNMVKEGALKELSAERVWKELSRALVCHTPTQFFEVLEQIDANEVLWPGIINNLPQLNAMAHHSQDLGHRLIALFWKRPLTFAKQFCAHWVVPNQYRRQILLVSEYSQTMTQDVQQAESLLKLLMRFDIFRRPDAFESFVLLLEVLGHAEQAQLMKQVTLCLQQIDESTIARDAENPAAAIYEARLKAVQLYLSN